MGESCLGTSEFSGSCESLSVGATSSEYAGGEAKASPGPAVRSTFFLMLSLCASLQESWCGLQADEVDRPWFDRTIRPSKAESKYGNFPKHRHILSGLKRIRLKCS